MNPLKGERGRGGGVSENEPVKVVPLLAGVFCLAQLPPRLVYLLS